MKYICIAVLEDGRTMDFEIDTDSGIFIMDVPSDGYPDWVGKLARNCNGCPKAEEDETCGAGMNVYKITDFFDDVASIERITLTYVSNRGEVLIRNLRASDGLRFIFLAALSFSECPVFARSAWAWEYYSDYIDPKRLFYVLLSSRLVVSAIHQDFELSMDTAMRTVHDDLRQADKVFRAIFEAIQGLSEQDANVNALSTLIHLNDLLKLKANDYIADFRSQIDFQMKLKKDK